MSKYKKSRSNRGKSYMALIKCECGHEILLIPDLKAMSNAVEDHVLEHLKKTDEDEAEAIRVNLISQILQKATAETKTS
jgi:hypothetical protein